ILLDLQQEALLFQVVQNPIRRRLIDGRLARQLTETRKVDALVIERSHWRQTFFATQGEVLLAAAGRDVNDAGPLCLADQGPGDDAMSVSRGLPRGPALPRGHLSDHRGKASGMLLGRQLIERAVVGPADHIGAGDLALELVATLLLEDLLQRLELRHTLDPFL